jgi:hypothetical protein
LGGNVVASVVGARRAAYRSWFRLGVVGLLGLALSGPVAVATAPDAQAFVIAVDLQSPTPDAVVPVGTPLMIVGGACGARTRPCSPALR